MARYLVVAHETATSPRLIEKLQHIAETDRDAQFVLLVPATSVRHLVFRRGHHEDPQAVAQARADEAAAAYQQQGITLAAARVGAADPLEAVDAEVQAFPGYAGFVVSTLPAERSRWARMHLPDKVAAKYGLPVHRVETTFEEMPYVLP